MLSNKQKIKHLLHRGGFGPNPATWRSYSSLTPEQLLETLLDKPTVATFEKKPELDRPVLDRENFMDLSDSARMELREDDEQRLLEVRNRWISEMADRERGALHEKMTLFWHGHFACKCRGSGVAQSYLKTLRRHALGKFSDLLTAVAMEPAMIRFLNNQQNRKGNPNENFARELLELFTMGEGNYAEQDIKEAARAFTGWSSSFDGRFVFRRQQHDYGEKSFMGHSGRLNGDDVIRIVLKQEETAFFVAGKIYRFFVNEHPDQSHIRELGKVLFDTGYDIEKTMRHLFSAPWFYDEKHVGARIKSPVELLVHHIKLFGITFANTRALLFLQNALGQVLFDPPNVAGWPEGQDWINNSTLMLRLNLAAYLLQQERIDHASLPSLKAVGPSRIVRTLQVDSNLQPMLELFYGTDYKVLESKVKDMLLASNNDIPALTFPREYRSPDYARKLVIRIVSLPEFQMA